MADLDYIECAGVRVPENWTLDKLRKALANRNIRFSNERAIKSAFGDSIELKRSLEKQIHDLQADVARFSKCVATQEALLTCPQCGRKWSVDIPAIVAKNVKGG